MEYVESMTVDERIHESLLLYTGIHSRLGDIALSYLATLQKISEISRTKWPERSLEGRDPMEQMKELSTAALQFSEFLHENAIMALAKIIEDTSIELKRHAKFKFDPIKNNHGVIHLKELQTIRALANIIKHNVSQLERNTSESAKFLVDECNMKDGRSLHSFINRQHESFDITEHIPKVYLAMIDLVEKAIGVKHPLLNLEYDDAFNKIYIALLPKVLNITRPNKITEPLTAATPEH